MREETALRNSKKMRWYASALWFNVTAVLTCCALAQDEDSSEKLAANESNTKAPFTIGKDTTFLTAPLTPDGKIDYFQAFDERIRDGVTAENNAAIPLFQALGPTCVPAESRQEFFERLGIPIPSSDQQSFLPFESYLAEVDVAGDVDQLKERRRGFDRRPWVHNDFPHLHAWIQWNRKPLDAIVESCHRSQLYIPFVLPQPADDDKLTVNMVRMIQPGYTELREACFALGARAMLRLGEGDVASAHSDLLALHRLARLVGKTPLLLQTVRAYHIDTMADFGDFAVAQVGNLTAKQALEMESALRRLEPIPDVATTMDIGARFMFLDVAQETVYGSRQNVFESLGPARKIKTLFGFFPSGVPTNYDISLRMGNEMFDRLVAKLKETDPEKRAALGKEIDEAMTRIANSADAKQIVRDVFAGKPLPDALGEAVGAILLSAGYPAFSLSEIAEQQAHVSLDLARLAYALAAFQAEAGRYPERLEQLAPAFIPNIPLDPFGDEPYRYSTTEIGYKLYSVGRNGRDDQGRNNSAADDLAVPTVIE